MSTDNAPIVEKGTCPVCHVENLDLKEINGLLVCEKCSSRKFSSKVRKSIEEALERTEEQRRRQAWKRRMEIAKQGVMFYQQQKFPEALRQFREYINILELGYRVPPGGLRVSLFDSGKDMSEILLIAGVFWDMAKIYDHKKGHDGDMRLCLNKFIEFSIGRKHVVMSSEALRKYIASGSPVHADEFKSAYMVLRKHLPKCFIATAVYGPESHEVSALRHFRDTILSRSSIGRTIINFYYKMSPNLAVLLVKHGNFAVCTRVLLYPATAIARLIFSTKGREDY